MNIQTKEKGYEMVESIVPKGILQIEVIDVPTNTVVQYIETENFITNDGIVALATQLIQPDSQFIIKELLYGDGAINVAPPKNIASLYHKLGSVNISSSIIESVLEPSLTLLFSIKQDATDTLVYLVNELALSTQNGKLFSYVVLEGDEVLVLEPNKKINIVWKYIW